MDLSCVGALFRYNGNRYRLTGFLKEKPLPELPGGLVGEVLALCRAEDEAKIPKGMRQIRLHWCLPEEATHISGAGTAGCIAALGAVEFTGKVSWPEELLADSRDHALRLGEAGELATTIIRPM